MYIETNNNYSNYYYYRTLSRDVEIKFVPIGCLYETKTKRQVSLKLPLFI